MVLIQLDINEGLNKKLKIYSIINDCNNKQEAIIKVLEEKL